MGQLWPNGLRDGLVTRRLRVQVSGPAGIVGGGSELPALSVCLCVRALKHYNKDFFCMYPTPGGAKIVALKLRCGFSPAADTGCVLVVFL